MKSLRIIVLSMSFIFLTNITFGIESDVLSRNIQNYFDSLFKSMKEVADKNPTVDNFRELMKPGAETIKGLYGATFIDADWVIRQVYFPTHFLAKGFDLKKVKELKYFQDLMIKTPAPQLSEPGHGSIFQPRLIAMRYPVITDGKMVNLISMMIRTEYFLEETGLDTCTAFKIICLGQTAEEKGTLSANFKEIKLELPSTTWVIQYEG